MFSKEMTYLDLKIKAGMGGIDLELGAYKKSMTFEEFVEWLYPFAVAEAKKEETQP